MMDIASLHLAKGSHRSPAEGLCLLEAVAAYDGQPHSDHPAGVDVALGAFGRAWNDALPDADRDRLLKPYISRLAGTAAGPTLAERRGLMALDWLIRIALPTWLDLVPSLAAHARTLRGLVAIDSFTPAQIAGPAMRAASKAARAAARAAAGDAAMAAARAAAGAAAGAAAAAAAWDAAMAAGAAARVAASDAARVAAGDAAWAAAGKALRPTIIERLQKSAISLLDRMIEAGRNGE